MSGNETFNKQIELFVPGRICLFGEHSDWAGSYRRINSKINKGYAIICGTNQGLYARVSAAPGRLIFHSSSHDGQKKTCDIPLDRAKLLEVASDGGYFSYVAGVAFQICTHYHVDGIEIDNYKTDLPLKKGLSSSAAVCVLVARAFNRLYDLKMTTRGEMEIAYQGEITTPSRCGRMDQGGAYGSQPILMTFDGDALHVDELHVAAPIHYVIVDLKAKKDTVKILADLNRSYPFPESELDLLVHKYLGPINERIVARAKNSIENGELKELANCITHAQEEFDKALIAACPKELTAPVLHQVISKVKLISGVLGGKGVGSQGDGTAQFLVADKDSQHRIMKQLSEELDLESLACTIQPTKQVRKAVITAAGYGTRLFPLTMLYRKEFMPVQNLSGDLMPLLLVHVLEALSAGIEEIALVIQAEEEPVFRRFFNKPMRPEVFAQLAQEKQKVAVEIENAGAHITYIHQGESRGLGGAVIAAADWVGKQPFLLILGDHYFIPKNTTDNNLLTCYQQLISAYSGLEEMLVGIVETPAAHISRFGVVSGVWEDKSDLLRISELKEKPDLDYASQHLRVSSLDKDTFYTVFGLYVLPHNIFSILAANDAGDEYEHGELQLTGAMEQLRRLEGGYGIPIRGRKIDIGVPEEYLRALRGRGGPFVKALVTGSAGFIGYHLAQRLAADGVDVTGIDNLNNFYDVRLKYGRLESAGFEQDRITYGNKVHSRGGNQSFVQLDLTDAPGLHDLFHRESFDIVCHLAAQAGVRYSVENPQAYTSSNIDGFLNILEGCRHSGPDVLCYASSSSIYGLNSKVPFCEGDVTDTPASIYAATKKSNELMAAVYEHLYTLRAIGLRFFTVYGPWGRPDMAIYRFTKNILSGKPISLYNNGNMKRDFTFVDDIVEGVIRVMDGLISGNTGMQSVYNIGRGTPVDLMDFVHQIEQATGKEAILQYEPMQPGDMETTWADMSALQRDFGYAPAVSLSEGVESFVRWYESWISK